MACWRAQLASRVLWAGGIIAYPTEAVWGLGCLPGNLDGVLRILELKERPMSQGLILVASDIEQLSPYLGTLTARQRRRLEESWPGPVTYLVPHGGEAPPWITGGRDTVALRVADHPVVKTICEACGSAIVSTSANPAGRPPAKSITRLHRYFGGRIDLVYPGVLGGRDTVSEIRDLASDRVVRGG